MSVTAVSLDGIPLGRSMRPVYAWYGDMELAPHLWQMVRLGRLTVRVEFHEPVTVERFGSRKALAEHCWRVVADGVDRAVSGRPRPVVRAAARSAGGISGRGRRHVMKNPAFAGFFIQANFLCWRSG